MKLIEVINNTLFKQYKFKVDRYLFLDNYNLATVVLKPKFSRCELKIKLYEIIHDKGYLSKIHPYDCYTMGIVNRLLQENNPSINHNKIKINHNNEHVAPFLKFIGIDYKKHSLAFEFLNSKTQHNITLLEFIKRPYIIRGLESHEALQLGFTIADILIINKDLKLNE